MTATEDLREGDVVLVVDLGTPRVTRAAAGGAFTTWKTVSMVRPDPYNTWECKNPRKSARWSVYFDDGSHAPGLRLSQWVLRD